MDFIDDDENDEEDDFKRPSNCGILSFHNGTELSMILEVDIV